MQTTLLAVLRDIFDQNRQLIQFAEAKNGGLIAFNAIMITASFALASYVEGWLWYAICYFGFMNGISLILAMTSLAAQKKAQEFRSEATENENFLFFGTIARLTPEKFLSGLKEKYELISSNPELEFDHARQLIIVSQIASRKFTRFNFALAFTIMSLITPVGYLIYYYGYDPNRQVLRTF